MRFRLPLTCVGLLLTLAPTMAAPPVASFLYPAGGQRGTKVPIRLGGLYVHDSCGFALDGPGVTASPKLKKTDRIWFEGPIIPLPDSQQPEDYPVDMLGSVAIDGQAPLGPRRGRIWTSQGVATGPVFVVGDLPEVVERETDGDPIPEKVTLPVTANGRIFPREDTDLWEVTLKKGQTLSALATTAGINSPLHAKLEILDVEGKTLAETGPQPALGFDASARIAAPADGTYRVRISDARGQGGPAFVYRLTLTTGPVADSVFPLGGRRGEKLNLSFAGPGVPSETVAVTIPADAGALWTTRFGTQPIPLDVDDLPEFTDSSAKVTAPAALNGRVEKGGVSSWKVELQRSKKYEWELRARKLGSPLCGTITVLDPNGKEVARQSGPDPGTDPTVALQPTADGVYTVQVSEQFRNRGGLDFAYRLRVREATAVPDFRFKLAVDALAIPRGGKAVLKVTAERLGGFNGPIDIALTGLPHGVTATKAVLGMGQTTADVSLIAEALAKVAVGRVAITGTAKLGDKTVSRTATLPGTNGLPEVGALLVAVAVPTPFAFTGDFTSATAPRGQPYARKFKLVRNGFDGPVLVGLADRQFRHLQGVTGPTVTVPAGATEFEYAALLPPWIEIGRTCRVCVVAVGVVRDPDGTEHKVSFTSSEQNHQMIVVPEPGRLGIDLAKSAIAVAPGESARLAVRVSRAKGLTGDVKVELRMPAHWRGVSAETITIPKDQEVGELLLKAGTGELGPFDGPAFVKATCGNVIAEAKLELRKRE